MVVQEQLLEQSEATQYLAVLPLLVAGMVDTQSLVVLVLMVVLVVLVVAVDGPLDLAVVLAHLDKEMLAVLETLLVLAVLVLAAAAQAQ
jgi:hypothetical protein